VTMPEVLIITPVKPGEADALKRYLAGLPRDPVATTRDGPRQPVRSPFSTTLPPTHFARLVVIELHRRFHLMFSSRFDGAVAEYLRALAATEEALTIWGHCEVPSVGGALDRERLERYLGDPRQRLESQYVVGAFPDAVTVGQVNAAVTLRAELSAFAARAAGLGQTALAHEFRQLPAIRHLFARL
jgi:hypothetical protein